MTFDVANWKYKVIGDKVEASSTSLDFHICNQQQIEAKLGNAEIDLDP